MGTLTIQEEIRVQRLSAETTRTPSPGPSAPVNSELTAGVIKGADGRALSRKLPSGLLPSLHLSPCPGEWGGGGKSKEIAQPP